MAGNINVNILSGFNDKGVRDALASLNRLRDGFKGFTKQLVGGYVGFQGLSKGLDFVTSSLDATRDLQRNLAGLGTIFGSATKEMTAFSSAGVQMGMSTAEAAKATTFIGSVLKQSGFALKDNTVLTKRLVSLGADLAATYGYDVQEALTGMTALFRGEYDPIEKFGVAIKQAQVNTEMHRMGLWKLTGQEKLHAQQLIRMKLLFEATSDVQGAFARQSGTLFVSQQKLASTWTNFKAVLGNSLIGPITNLTNLMSGLVTTIGPSLVKLFDVIGGQVGLAGAHAQNAAKQISGIVDQITILFQVASPILSGLVDLISNFGASIVISFVAFKTIVPVVKAVGFAVEALRGIMVGLQIAEIAAAGAAGLLTAAEVEALSATLAAEAALVATPWGAIALGIAATAAGVTFLVSELVKLMPAADGAHTSMAQFSQDMDTYASSGSVSGYGVALFELSGDLKQVKTSALESAAALSAAREETDLYVKGAKAATRKTYKADAGSAAVNSFEQQLAALKKGLSTGGLGGAAAKAAKAMADPFVKMTKSIQDEMSKLHDSLMSAFDITAMGTNGSSMAINIEKLMVKMRKFSDVMRQLKSMGLNGSLMSQLAMAGPEKGLAAASALAGDQNLINQANAAYGEMNTLSTGIASNVVQAKAAPVYNISVNAGVGDKRTIGMAVVEAIKSYERTNGAVWKSA